MQNGSLQKYFRSEITAMSPYKPGEQPQTGKSIKLNTNENPYPPSPKVLEAIVAAKKGISFVLDGVQLPSLSIHNGKEGKIK